VNLFKLLACALALNSNRTVILSQQDNFPTDLYMAQGLERLLGEQRCRLKQVSSANLESELDDTVAVLMLTQVNFRTGDLHDMQRMTELAQQKGILVIWDLAHSAGAFPVYLDDAKVDFAVGCGYKYLNGGPGAPAFVYVAERHQTHISQPLQGWMGHRQPFAFKPDYAARDGVIQFLAGTPAILSMVALDAALDVFADVDLCQLHEKSIALSELFIKCVAESSQLQGVKLLSPTDSAQRGSQVAYKHAEAFAISQALIANNVIVDFREPNIVRFGFAPLYTRYIDIWQATQTLTRVIEEQIYLNSRFQMRDSVT
jgi:kynureninase